MSYFPGEFVAHCCGRRATFVANSEPGGPDDMAHQKDAQMVEAYSDFWEREFDGAPREARTVWPKRMLEIGICRGGSLALWHDLLPAAQIVAVDNNLGLIQPGTREHLEKCCAPNIEIKHLDVLRETKKLGELGEFDLIVDDGPHGPKATIPAFEVLWPKLRPGGLYIVEDWHHDHLEPERHLTYYLRRLIGNDWRKLMPDYAEPFRMVAYRAFFCLEKRA